MGRVIRKVFFMANSLRAAAVLVASVVPIVLVSNIHGQSDPDVNATLACYKKSEFYNKERLLTGAVNEECGGGWHSAPFGNWGVDSPHGGRYDGYQFPGWKISDGWFQWNSCTTKKKEYRAPSPCHRYYNDGRNSEGQCTTQKTTRGSERYAKSIKSYYYVHPYTYPCTSLVSGAEVFNDLYMHMYELDSDGDDSVTKLSYRTVSVPMSCDDETDSCSGTSGWYSPYYSSGSETGVTAKIQVKVSIYPAS